MLGALAAEDDESYEYTLTIARLEHELSEIQQSVSALSVSFVPLMQGGVDEKRWYRSSRKTEMP
jgi:hypothetical protein